MTSEDKKSQLDKFKQAAKELDTDDSEDRFDANLRRIGKAKPPKGKKGVSATSSSNGVGQRGPAR